MKTVRPVLACFLILLLTGSSVVLGQGTTQTLHNWTNLTLVPPGDELIVKRKDGKTLKGRLAGATDQAVTLSRKNKLVELDRTQISRIFRRVQKHGETATSTGASIGALAGVGLGIAAARSSEGEVSVIGAALGLALLGAGVGALIGAVFDVKPPTVLIYQAR